MLIVQKYGGATLADPEKIIQVAKKISDLKKSGKNVVAVVSAMGQTTNQLIHLAHQVSKNPAAREMDMLLSVGERTSMALVSIALNDLGHQAISFTGSQAGILTNDSHVNAMIIDVKPFRVVEALKENKIVILAGFQGVNPVTKEITTLGRGGSDTSAVAMAAALNADRCEILKDVASIFSADPKLISNPLPIQKLNYDLLLEMTTWGAKVLHYKSVELAKEKNVKLFVGPAAENQKEQSGTIIQNDIQFKTTEPIAVNSHAQIFEIKGQSNLQTIEVFMNTLKDQQIAFPQVFTKNKTQDQKNESEFFITAPSEVLSSIQYCLEKSTQFKITKSNLCSVSLTCTNSPNSEIKANADSQLKKANIQPYCFIESNLSLNFILQTDQKIQAVQVLHSLITNK